MIPEGKQQELQTGLEENTKLCEHQRKLSGMGCDSGWPGIREAELNPHVTHTHRHGHRDMDRDTKDSEETIYTIGENVCNSYIP